MRQAIMKSLIINISIHHNNTQKIAEAMAEVLGAKVVKPTEAIPEELLRYDLVGFGSGIYDYKHHPSLLKLADMLPQISEKKAFLFSTSGVAMDSSFFVTARQFHDKLREKLQAKGYEIAGEYNCVGFNTNSILKYFGGMNKGRPNEEDLRKAKELAKKLIN